MTLALASRGRVCNDSPALAVGSWGVICRSVRTISEEDIRFDVEELVRCGQIIYNKKGIVMFVTPRVTLTSSGSRSPNLFNKNECSAVD